MRRLLMFLALCALVVLGMTAAGVSPGQAWDNPPTTTEDTSTVPDETTTGDDEECEPVDGVIPEECEDEDETPCPEGQEGTIEEGCVIPPVVTTGETPPVCPEGEEFDDIYGGCVETSPPPDASPPSNEPTPPTTDQPVPAVHHNCQEGFTLFQGTCYPRGVAGSG